MFSIKEGSSPAEGKASSKVLESLLFLAFLDLFFHVLGQPAPMFFIYSFGYSSLRIEMIYL